MLMDLTKIEALLERYWEGETTVGEEQELKAFFAQEEIPEHLGVYAPLFQYLGGQQVKTAPRIEARPHLKMNNTSIEKAGKKQVKMISWFARVAKVAAVGLVLAVATYLVREEYLSNKQQVQPVVADTFEDPQKAFEETKKALMLISKNFGKGRKQMQKLGVLHEAQQKIKGKEEKEL